MGVQFVFVTSTLCKEMVTFNSIASIVVSNFESHMLKISETFARAPCNLIFAIKIFSRNSFSFCTQFDTGCRHSAPMNILDDHMNTTTGYSNLMENVKISTFLF